MLLFWLRLSLAYGTGSNVSVVCLVLVSGRVRDRGSKWELKEGRLLAFFSEPVGGLGFKWEGEVYSDHPFGPRTARRVSCVSVSTQFCVWDSPSMFFDTPRRGGRGSLLRRAHSTVTPGWWHVSFRPVRCLSCGFGTAPVNPVPKHSLLAEEVGWEVPLQKRLCLSWKNSRRQDGGENGVVYDVQWIWSTHVHQGCNRYSISMIFVTVLVGVSKVWCGSLGLYRGEKFTLSPSYTLVGRIYRCREYWYKILYSLKIFYR